MSSRLSLGRGWAAGGAPAAGAAASAGGAGPSPAAAGTGDRAATLRSKIQETASTTGRPAMSSTRARVENHLGSSKVSNTVWATWNTPHAATA